MKQNLKIIVVHVIWRQGDKVECLLIRQAKGALKGNWQMVAGKINEEETAVQGALRELREETGRSPDAFYCADFVETFFNPVVDSIFFAPTFVAFLDEKEPIHLSLSEHDEYQWLPFEKALNLLEFSGQRMALEHIEREFIRKKPNARFLLETSYD